MQMPATDGLSIGPRVARRSILILMALWLSPSLDAAEAEGEAQARTIVLVRHGHYAADPKADPFLGPGLTDLGVAQARLLGARLAGMPKAFDVVMASPMIRAQETARVIVADLGQAPIETVADLAECTPPTRRADVVAGTSAEDLADCARQLNRLFETQFRPAHGQPDRLLMVAHGNVTRYLITKVLGVDSKAWLEMSIGHTSMTTMRIEADGSYRLLGAGDVGHLPPNLQTGTISDPERNLAVPAE